MGVFSGAAGNDRYANLAAIQKGRALLNLGQYSQAASAVATERIAL